MNKSFTYVYYFQMEQIEEIGQRIYSIQECLEYIANGMYDKKAIAQLSAQIKEIEESLCELEKHVDSQLPLLNLIPDLIVEIKEMHEACMKLPAAEHVPKQQVAHLSIRNVDEVEPKQISSTKQSQLTKVRRQSKIPQPTRQQTDYIDYVTEEELLKSMKSINFRIKLENINQWISEINAILSKKVSIMKVTNPNMVRQCNKQLWERYKSEELPDESRLFFTPEDIKGTSFATYHRIMLIILQKIGRLSVSTDSHLCRYFIK